jgi:hypothetical protein
VALSPSQATFRNDFIADFRYKRHLSANLFSTTPSNFEIPLEIQRYLCQETYPIGSLNSKVGAELVNMIEKLTKDGSMESVQLAFELLDRLAQDVQFETKQENQRTNPISDSNEMKLGLSFPSGLVHDVIKAWSLCWTAKSTDLSPRQMFEKLVGWESLPSDSHSTVVAYNMIMHAASNSQDPDLADEILKHLLKSTDRHLYPNVVTFSSVIDAWAKSGRQDAPSRAEALLKEMIALSDAGWHEASPNVVTFTSVISAWANSGDEQAPQRAEELLHEMARHGLVQTKSLI